MTLEIYTVGHPRSGNTWIGRLLSDILKAEYRSGTTPGDYELQYWGEGTPNKDYRILKTHSREALPSKSVFIYRDPRDVFCSIWHYRDKYASIEEVIRTLGDNSLDPDSDLYGQYENYVRYWWNTGKATTQIRYEDLHFEPVKHLSRIIYFLTGGVKWSTQDIINGIFNQEFTRVKAVKAPTQDHAMWTGKPGNWINYFTRRDADLTQSLFGNLLMDQGYITSPDWVHEISL